MTSVNALVAVVPGFLTPIQDLIDTPPRPPPADGTCVPFTLCYGIVVYNMAILNMTYQDARRKRAPAASSSD